MDKAERAVRAWAEEVGLNGTESQWRACAQVVELIRRYGKVMNLSSDLEPAALWCHVEEALAAVVALERSGGTSERWLDLGSGGGFPGLVFASWLDAPGVLVEPRQKRADFLRLALGALGARTKVLVQRARLESDGWISVENEKPGGVFGWVSARAVFEVNLWLVRARDLVAENGRVLVHTRAGWLNSGEWRNMSMVECRNGNTVAALQRL